MKYIFLQKCFKSLKFSLDCTKNISMLSCSTLVIKVWFGMIILFKLNYYNLIITKIMFKIRHNKKNAFNQSFVRTKGLGKKYQSFQFCDCSRLKTLYFHFQRSRYVAICSYLWCSWRIHNYILLFIYTLTPKWMERKHPNELYTQIHFKLHITYNRSLQRFLEWIMFYGPSAAMVILGVCT